MKYEIGHGADARIPVPWRRDPWRTPEWMSEEGGILRYSQWYEWERGTWLGFYSEGKL